jgi:hypothetical protein
VSTRTKERIPLSVIQKRDLWVAAAGRCQFRACNQPLDRGFLGKRIIYRGEFAHVIADSPGGPRGVAGTSEALANDIANIMLACPGCHQQMDYGGKKNPYSADTLYAMKREHEERIQLVYTATPVTESLPIVLSFPIGPHAPVIEMRQIHHAMLQNSGFKHFPREGAIHIDRTAFDHHDGSLEFWKAADHALTTQYRQRIEPLLTGKTPPAHLSIAAFAPMPMLMRLGALIGDKTPAAVMDLPLNGWMWDQASALAAPKYEFAVPDTLPREVDVLVSISNRVVAPLSGRSAVEFRAAEPGRGIIRTEIHLQEFRREFDRFLQALVRGGARVVHVHPAAPLSACVEIGRVLLPKTFEEVHAWEWRAPDWVQALRLR